MVETGARKSEVLGAKWEDIDLDAGLWRIPSPKAGHPQVAPLTTSTVAMLRHAPRRGPWVVPAITDSERHRSDLKNEWKRLREAAELQGVTVHDIRRSFGLRVAKAAGLHVASKLLRHSDVRVTEKVYVPLGIDDLRKALESSSKPGEVVPINHEQES